MKTCASCGYLALKRDSKAKLLEADTKSRTTGLLGYAVLPAPVCFLDAYDLQDEYFSASGAFGHVKVLEVLRKSREDCPDWTEWLKGYSPKEHRRMLWEREQQAEANRKWRIGVVILAFSWPSPPWQAHRWQSFLTTVYSRAASP